MKRFWASKPPWSSEPPFSPRRLVLRVPAPSASSEVLLLMTCLISEHPNSSLFIFAAQLTFWICGLVSVLSCGAFSAIMPLPRFLFPYLLRLWLDTSGSFSLYLLWLLISFTLSTSLSPKVAFWIISPVHVKWLLLILKDPKFCLSELFLKLDQFKCKIPSEAESHSVCWRTISEIFVLNHSYQCPECHSG